MALTGAIASYLKFLHAGYPQGVPERDYIPLLALLRRKLSEDEVIDIADELIMHDETTSNRALLAAISNVTNQTPSDDDIARVRGALAAGGWPLAGLDDPGHGTNGSNGA